VAESHAATGEPVAREGEGHQAARLLGPEDAVRLHDCLARDGVALIPTDTIYGLACDPRSETAVRRLYELKRRPRDRPAAVMFLSLEGALEALPELGQEELDALRALLPGPLTVLLANPAERFPLACGPEPGVLGVRVPQLPERLAALSELGRPLLQSSANISGAPEARRLEDVATELRLAVGLELDGGELAGVASTVLDLTRYGSHREWEVVREGPLSQAYLEQVLC
jgi:L-threonylcarbamoyladenylate synthase